MKTMFRRLLLVSLLSASSWLMAQSSAPPDAPAPQADAGHPAAPSAAQQPTAKPSAQPDPSDPASRPDWKPGESDQGYEKKSMGERMKDQVSSPVCVNGHCFGGKKPGDEQSDNDRAQGPGPNQKPPRSDDEKRSLNEDGESSSRSTIIDLAPPKDDARNHPESSAGDDQPGDVSETKKWDPHRAAKNLEVGDYYFNRQNYIGAESRYQEALVYKDNFAEAMFKLAVTEEKLDHPDDARKYYGLYLKTLPEGDHAQESRAGLARLGGTTAKTTQ
jgi:tetratricopeptide (TPR) repeat protein